MKPTAELSHEHLSIVKMIGILGKIAERLDAGGAVPPDDPARCVEFLRVFADKCHHAKEEDHLFPEMEKVGMAREAAAPSASCSRNMSRAGSTSLPWPGTLAGARRGPRESGGSGVRRGGPALRRSCSRSTS